MALADLTDSSPSSPSEIVQEAPRWGFWKGLLVGTIVEIPAISAAVLLLPRLGLGEPEAAMTVVRMTSLFVGLPALITSGGLGRLAAYESVKRRRREAIGRIAAVHALAGLLLTFIAALPHGYLPQTALDWMAMGLAGLAAGAVCGAAIGVMCTGAPPRQVSEVISLVTRPGVTLRQLIESEDLGRIGAAVRHRASLMFDGLLDPAAPRPEIERKAEGEEDGKEAASVEAREKEKIDVRSESALVDEGRVGGEHKA
jgi:hypothetical protein